VLRLALPDLYEHLKGGSLVDQLANALADSLGGLPKISFVAAQAARETLHQRSARERDQRQIEAETAFAADPSVQRLVTEYGARIVPDSVRPLDR
jgi:DNA polymerase III subunit gamma/tau